jgi:hypothetical protein
MGIQLPDGVHPPESNRSKLRQKQNASIARGRRSYQNAADAALASIPINFVALPILAVWEYQKIHEAIDTDWLATGLTIFAIAAEYIVSNYLLSLAAQDHI